MRRLAFLSALLFFFLITTFSLSHVQGIFAQTDTPTDTPSGSPTPTGSDNQQTVQDLQNKINDLQGKISDLQGQEKTLSQQISVMDNNIELTQYRIQSTKQQITQLQSDINVASKRINQLDNSLSQSVNVLLKQIVATYEYSNVQPVQVLASSNNINDYFTKENYLKLVQARDKKLLYNVQAAKDDYANQKKIFQNQQQQMIALNNQLEQYNTQLNSEKTQKQDLLSETQGSEENYQRILAQTKAQLAGFQNFVTSRGGAGLLSSQTVCDSWGCYYNQRDSQWGGMGLNGTVYTLADSGCLLTSMAMVYTHYGHKDVTPVSINSVSSNFDGIPPALLKFTISANGVTAQRISTDIDSTLASGNPVIVGISYDGGPYPDHFVVFVSGSGGDYTMNDPYTANGHNISFRGTYPNVRIVEEDKVSI